MGPWKGQVWFFWDKVLHSSSSKTYQSLEISRARPCWGHVYTMSSLALITDWLGLLPYQDMFRLFWTVLNHIWTCLKHILTYFDMFRSCLDMSRKCVDMPQICQYLLEIFLILDWNLGKYMPGSYNYWDINRRLRTVLEHVWNIP